jgi:hypothetical protein
LTRKIADFVTFDAPLTNAQGEISDPFDVEHLDRNPKREDLAAALTKNAEAVNSRRAPARFKTSHRFGLSLLLSAVVNVARNLIGR